MPESHASNAAMGEKAIIVIGAGDALGGAIARRFAAEGYAAVIVRRHADQLQSLTAAIRDAGGEAHPFGVDARQEAEMIALFEKVEAEIAPVEVCVFNIGANVRFPLSRPPAVSSRRSGRWRVSQASWPAGRPPGS